jgi:hypothetical protein
MKKIRILDLDNCICDDQWRLARINWRTDDLSLRYANYHKQCSFDEFKNRDLVQTADDIVIFTARPAEFRSRTETWLMMNKISPIRIMMRPDGDHRCSVELKKSMLLQLLKHEAKTVEISCAYDDRQDIVDMYIDNCIKSELRKIHAQCAMTKPTFGGLR